MRHAETLPLFQAEQQQIMIPRYGIRLVKESEIMYDNRRINGAAAVSELMQFIGLHGRSWGR